MTESLNNISSKSRLAAALLCFFLGCFGAHRFYLESVYKLPIFSMSQRAECASSDKFSISYVQGQL